MEWPRIDPDQEIPVDVRRPLLQRSAGDRFGGSGFLGRHIVRALARRGWRVRVAVRRPDLADFLQPLGDVGQVHAVQANLRYPASIAAALDGRARSSINASGREGRAAARRPIEAVHVAGAARDRAAPRRRGDRRARSCLRHRRDPEFALALHRQQGARRDGDARGLSRRDDPAPVGRVRPGRRFPQPLCRAGPLSARRCRCSAAGTTKLQPVYVGDVAQAAARALDGGGRAGRRSTSSAAREIMTLREAAAAHAAQSVERRRFAAAPALRPLARLAGVTEFASALSLGLFPASR